MKLSRSLGAACIATAIFLAACRSVHTQVEPEVSSDPNAIQGSPSPSGSPAPSPTPTPSPMATPMSTPEATPTPSPTPTPTPKPLQFSYTAVEVDGPYIAITFDDGPHASLTPKLLDMLEARRIPATFFVVGRNAAEYPDILKRMDAEGHEIANHSWSHPALTRLGADAVAGQIEKTNKAVRDATGKTPVLMRPPYGATNARLDRRYNEEYGLKVILWSVDPLDWKYRNAARVTNSILSGTQPGGIILAHDIHATTVAAMPATLDGLLAKGYKFVTVSQLLAMERGRQPAPQPAATSEPAEPVAAVEQKEPFVVTRTESPEPAATPKE